MKASITEDCEDLRDVRSDDFLLMETNTKESIATAATAEVRETSTPVAQLRFGIEEGVRLRRFQQKPETRGERVACHSSSNSLDASSSSHPASPSSSSICSTPLLRVLLRAAGRRKLGVIDHPPTGRPCVSDTCVSGVSLVRARVFHVARKCCLRLNL